MCTSLLYKNYFGRNLDYDVRYGEGLVITPRNFPFNFRHLDTLDNHYAIIGVAIVEDNYPLYFDAVNEKGLGMAGLNFVGNAFYRPLDSSKNNVASFEFIPYILSKAANLNEAKALLENMNLSDDSFSPAFPPSELHWMIADTSGCIVVEATKSGLNIYDNPYGVLTNNPEFPIQAFSLNNYRALSNKDGNNTFNPNLSLEAYSRGMGAMGLPGDLSSMSRFAKIAFTRSFSLSEGGISDINQYFHILHSVEQQNGCTQVKPDSYEITLYSSCYDLENPAVYYTSYSNHQINKLSLLKENLDSNTLIKYQMMLNESINEQN